MWFPCSQLQRDAAVGLAAAAVPERTLETAIPTPAAPAPEPVKKEAEPVEMDERLLTEEEKPKEESTGNAELDKMLKDGRMAIAEMKRLDESIEDPAVSADIVRLQQVSEKIFARVKEEPTKLPQIRRFLDYYLPTTLKLLKAYDRASSAGISGENVDATKAKVSGMMKTIVTAFEKQLDALYGTEALDISTDLTVLENMMAREGLTDQPLKAQTNAGDDGIRLEL